VVVSPDRKLVAVGTLEGTLHFLHTETGEVTVQNVYKHTSTMIFCIFKIVQSQLTFFTYVFFKQEVKSLMSSGDGISGCIFLGEELLATTSFDGQVEVWDVASGCR